jgi:hypothetical protein
MVKKEGKRGINMSRVRLNVYVTDEAHEVIKQESERLGANMGVVLTMWALDKKKEQSAFKAIDMVERLEQQNSTKK